MPSTDRHLKSAVLLSVMAIVAIQAGMGLFATYLNRLFYEKYGPFYDSLAYFNSIAEMAAIAESEGRAAALVQTASRSTVFYPWLVFAAFAGKVGLDRSIAVWIQIFASTWMQLALFTYFYRQHRNAALAVILSSTFLGIAALFCFNGGIADFRMDLIQYFFYATSMAVYLVARKAEGRFWWAALGVSIGALCLARATSPIYLTLVFAVLAPIDIVTARGEARNVLIGWCLAAAVAMAVAGWFYLTNLTFLHYYYFVWNLDANAKLPVTQSAEHIIFMFRNVGWWLIGALALRSAIIALAAVNRLGTGELWRINWRALWFGAAPVAYLVLSGAGLNPFVSMLGAAGLVMFLLEPLASGARAIGRSLELVLLTVVLAGVAINATRAVGNHSRDDRVSSWVPCRDGLIRLTRAIEGQMSTGERRDYRYAVAHVGRVTADTVFNVLAFDTKLPVRPRATIVYGAATLSRCYQGVATPVEWGAHAGSSDDEKIAQLVELLTSHCDFFVMSTSDSELPASTTIHQFIPEINRRLLQTQAWRQVTEPLSISPTERVILLRNSARDR